MELTGKIKSLPELQTFASGFQKRECVLLTEEQYPQPINIEFLSDKIDLLDAVKEGDKVKIGINIRGREWTSPQGETKYFNSIVGWRVEKLEDAAPTPTPDPKHQTAPAKPVASNPLTEEEDDDLPF